MELTIRAITPAERLYVCDQNKHIADQSGHTGRLWGHLNDTGIAYLKSLEIKRPTDKAPGFRAEFDTVLDMLRFDERYGHVLKDLTTMTSFCADHPQGQLANCVEYAFRADTQNYSYLIRCIPQSDHDHVFIYHYHRDRLDRHMKQAEKGIRFVGLDGMEKFRIPDGERIRITTSGAGTRNNTARYVDDSHFLVVTDYDSYLYHIHEFAEWLERHNGTVIPLRSTLPDKCFGITEDKRIVTIVKGEMGHLSARIHAGVRTYEDAIAANEAMGVTKAQEAAMMFGCIYGWDKPGADPKNYDDQGQPIKPKHRDRGDAR